MSTPSIPPGVRVVAHPLVAHRLSQLRCADASPPMVRSAIADLTGWLIYEATGDLAVEPSEVQTPLAQTVGVRLRPPAPVLIPVLRAGLGMLAAATAALPEADVGFLGLARDEATLQAATYADRLPAELTGRRVLVLDPMLATGGTAVAAVRALRSRGSGPVRVVCLLAAPEGLARLAADVDDGDLDGVVTAAIDSRLDARGFIVPGLGDAGDRLYGKVSGGRGRIA